MKAQLRNLLAQEIRDLFLKHGVSQSISDATLKAMRGAIAAEAAEELSKRQNRPRGRPRLPTDELLAAARLENVDPNADPAEVARRAIRARRTLQTRTWRERHKGRTTSND